MLDQISAPPLFACPDWWEKIQRGETPMPDIPVNEADAAKARAFFNRLRLPDVAGQPRLRDACGDWFRDLLIAFLCSEDEDGKRLVWECLCMVPKKSSKTTYSAALGLTALYMEDVRNREMLIVAPSQNISQRCYKQARGMIMATDDMREIFHVQDNTKIITRRFTDTSLSVKTFDTGIITGEIPVLTIIDEVHELGKKNGAANVMQQIRGGGITQHGGQVLMITTQSDKRPAGIWRTELDKARAIRDGKGGASPIMLPILYEFPEELQRTEAFWRKQENWDLILPNLGLSIDRERLVADFENNGQASKEIEQIWVSQHLNIEIGIGLHVDRWFGTDYWPAAAVALTLDEIIANSDVCTVGIDPGGADDLLGLAVIGRHAETQVWQHWSRTWADRIVLERRKSIADQLAVFEAQGDLVMVDDLEAEAYAEIVQICERLRDADLFAEKDCIGVDSAGSAAGLVIDALMDAEFLPGVLRPIPQGYRMNNVIGVVGVKLKSKKFVHCGQPIMEWCIGNAKTEAKQNAEIITKAESGKAKIDPLMALFDAAELMQTHPRVASGAVVVPADHEVA